MEYSKTSNTSNTFETATDVRISELTRVTEAVFNSAENKFETFDIEIGDLKLLVDEIKYLKSQNKRIINEMNYRTKQISLLKGKIDLLNTVVNNIKHSTNKINISSYFK